MILGFVRSQAVQLKVSGRVELVEAYWIGQLGACMFAHSQQWTAYAVHLHHFLQAPISSLEVISL